MINSNSFQQFVTVMICVRKHEGCVQNCVEIFIQFNGHYEMKLVRWCPAKKVLNPGYDIARLNWMELFVGRHRESNSGLCVVLRGTSMYYMCIPFNRGISCLNRLYYTWNFPEMVDINYHKLWLFQ